MFIHVRFDLFFIGYKLDNEQLSAYLSLMRKNTYYFLP